MYSFCIYLGPKVVIYLSIYLSIYLLSIYMYIDIYINIYIYRERERLL